MAWAEEDPAWISAQSMALGGAHRGLGAPPDAMVVNPAGIALISQYSLDFQYSYSSPHHLSMATISAVDSKSGPVAGAMALSYRWGQVPKGPVELMRIHAGAAYLIGSSLAVGISGQNIRGRYGELLKASRPALYNSTLGLGLRIGDMFSVGASYQNFLSRGFSSLMPKIWGAGVALYIPKGYVAADMAVSERLGSWAKPSWNAGGAYFVLENLALRLGWRYASIPHASIPNDAWHHFLAGGLSASGGSGALHVGIEKALTHRSYGTLLAGVQIFL